MSAPRKVNDIVNDYGSYLVIDISTPKHPDTTMLIDTDVFEEHQRLERGRIYACVFQNSKYIYAIYRASDKIRKFHHDVLALEDGLQCDHIRHGTKNYVDNTRGNLRNVTCSQNQMNKSKRSDNSSGVTGVYRAGGKFYAQITIDGKTESLGTFDSVEEAAQVRKMRQKEVFGAFAFQSCHEASPAPQTLIRIVPPRQLAFDFFQRQEHRYAS